VRYLDLKALHLILTENTADEVVRIQKIAIGSDRDHFTATQECLILANTSKAEINRRLLPEDARYLHRSQLRLFYVEELALKRCSAQDVVQAMLR